MVRVKHPKRALTLALLTTARIVIGTNLPKLTSARAPSQRIESKCLKRRSNGHFRPANGRRFTLTCPRGAQIPFSANHVSSPDVRTSIAIASHSFIANTGGSLSRGLFHFEALVRGDFAKLLHHARRPANLDAGLAIFVQSEVHGQVAA